MARGRRARSTDKKATTATAGRRALRARPTPKWLTGRPDLDDIARRRCLLVLSVLSGEKSVTEVVEGTAISRGTYYQLETKALLAMLAALAPGAESASSPDSAGTTQRIADLEAKVTRLEQEKRRAERMLYLARKVLPAGPVTTGPGRPRKARSSPSGGRTRLPSSPRKTKPTTASPASDSIPTPDGEPMP